MGSNKMMGLEHSTAALPWIKMLGFNVITTLAQRALTKSHLNISLDFKENIYFFEINDLEKQSLSINHPILAENVSALQ